MNRRLASMMAKMPDTPQESVILDCYNQAVVTGAAMTVTTRIDASNHYYLLEMLPKEPFMYRVPYGATRPGGMVRGHIAGALTTSSHEYNELVIEPIMEQKNANTRMLTPVNYSGDTEYRLSEVSATLTACQGGPKQAQYVCERTDKVMQTMQIIPDDAGRSWDNPQGGRVYSPDGVSPCLTTNTEGTIKIEEADIRKVGNIYPSGGQGGQVVSADGIAPTVCECHGEVTRVVEPELQFRIRKLHPIETYRLMNVDDEHIDKLINAKDEKGKPVLSRGAHYNLSGDSIVVNCLYLLFENLFYGDNTNPDPQLTLF